jgi:hypothetical protein
LMRNVANSRVSSSIVQCRAPIPLSDAAAVRGSPHGGGYNQQAKQWYDAD